MLDKVRPAGLATADRGNVDAIATTHPVNSQNKYSSLAVYAELFGSSTAIAFDIVGHGNTPILDLCRKLVEAGHDPGRALEAFRGKTLCLRIALSAKPLGWK